VRSVTTSRSVRSHVRGGSGYRPRLSVRADILDGQPIAQRRLTEPFTWANDLTLPHHEVRCASQQNSPPMAAMGQVRAKKLRPGCVRCSSDNRRNGDQAALTLRAISGLMHRSK
jgi:hypothetical protein